ncbi:MAG: DUF1295 domain-containing protein [Polyangia bacterium]
MHEHAIYRAVLVGWFVLSAVTFVILLVKAAPYGKHAARGWGPTIAPRWGWLLMESPAAVVMPALALPLLVADGWPLGWLLVGMWTLHYVNRGLVYPFRLRSTRPMPIVVVGLALFFNVMNGWLNARGITLFGPELGRALVATPRVLVGLVLFVIGLVVNWDADRRLFALPRSPDGGYSIPRGGLFELVTSPNYLGELVEWLGFALAAGSIAGLSFFVWTFANLVPRAVSHHLWYRRTFPDYPDARKAIIPYVL